MPGPATVPSYTQAVLGSIATVVALGISCAPWVVFCTRRFGGRVGITLVFGAVLVALLGIALVTAATGFPLAIAVTLATAGGGLAGVVVVIRDPAARIVGRGGRAAEWIASASGAAVWLLCLALSSVVPDAAKVGWVLAGDGFNNVDWARIVADDNGVPTGPGTNAAALPGLLLTILGAASGSTGHSIEVVAVLWSTGIAASCVVTGLIACDLIDPAHVRRRTVVAGLASLLPLTVVAGTLPMYWGFLNTAIALPIVLSSWFLLAGSSRHPLACAAGSLLLVTASCAVWGPLASIPAVALVFIVLRSRGELRLVRGVPMIMALLSLGQLGVFAALMFVPAALAQSSAFAADTIGFPSLWLPLGIVAIVIGAVAVLAYRTRPGVVWSLGAWGCGSAVAAAGTVALARGDASAYYPVKVAWFLLVGAGVLLIAVLAGWASRTRAGWPVAVVVACVLGTGVALPTAASGAAPLRPAPVMLFTGGLWWGGGETERLVAVVTRADARAVLWRTGFLDEGVVDFWSLLDGGGDFRGDRDLRRISFDAYRGQRAGSWQGQDAAELCLVLQRMDGVVVYTADPHLTDELAETCDVVDPAVRVIADVAEIR